MSDRAVVVWHARIILAAVTLFGLLAAARLNRIEEKLDAVCLAAGVCEEVPEEPSIPAGSNDDGFDQRIDRAGG